MNNDIKLTNVLVNKNNNRNFFVHDLIYRELLKELPVKEKKHIDKWLYIDHMMLTRYFFQDDKEKGIEINIQLLQKIVSCRRQKKILDWYLKRGFIKKVKNYSSGKHSAIYTYSDEIKFQPTIQKEVTDKTLNRKLQKENEPETPLEIAAKENLKELKIDRRACYYELKSLTFTENEIQEIEHFFGARAFFTYESLINKYNYQNATGNITYTSNDNKDNTSPYYYVNTFLEKKEKKKKRSKFFKFSINNAVVSSIDSKDIYCFRDANGKRLHTNLTVLKRELRKYLSVPGLDLVNMDIANSQPLILNTIFKGDEKYLTLCQTGQLWDYLMLKCDVSDRKAFKGDMFGEVFYCSLYTMNRSEKSQLFKTEFPKVWQFIYDYKKKNGKESLPIEMQRKESNIILDTVCQQLAKGLKWFATIHDSIICDRSESNNVKQLMMDAFNDYGIYPTIRIENL